MKALTLRAPYAHLLVSGKKQWETRGFQTKHEGLMAITASAIMNHSIRNMCLREPYRRDLKRAGWRNWSELPVASVVGTVSIVGCVPCDDVVGVSDKEQLYGDWDEGRYAWLCEDPIVLPEPVPVKGRLGVWTLDDDIAERVCAQVAKVSV